MLVSLGKHGSGRVMTQAEINERLVAMARSFDGRAAQERRPDGFARAAEELDCLVQHGIAVRDCARRDGGAGGGQLCGNSGDASRRGLGGRLRHGQEDDDKADSALDYAALARFPGTLVFYMGVTTAGIGRGADRRGQAGGDAGGDPPAREPARSAADRHDARRSGGGCRAAKAAAAGRVHRRRGGAARPGLVVVREAAAVWPEGAGHAAEPSGRRSGAAAGGAGADVLLQPAIEIRPAGDPVAPSTGHSSGSTASTGWCFPAPMACGTFFDRLPTIGRDVRALGQDQDRRHRPGNGRGAGAVSFAGRRRARRVSRRIAGQSLVERVPAASGFCWSAPAAAAKCWPRN